MLSIELKDLRFCRKDMEGLQDALVKARFCKAEDIRILVSGGTTEPTEANVRSTLRELLSHVQRGDRVLIAFSGHGIALRLGKDAVLPTDFVCCADTNVRYNAAKGNFDSLQGLIDRVWIESELDKSSADVKLLFFDACRNELGDLSGIAKSMSSSSDVASSRSPVTTFGIGSINAEGFSVSPVKAPKLFRFSSGMAGTVSQEFAAEIEHGVFTYFLIKGMLGAAPQYTVGEITLHDLSEYVRRETQKFVSTRIPGASQIPNGVALPIDRWHPDEVVFSYPYVPGRDPLPDKPVLIAQQEPPTREPVREQTPEQTAPRLTQEEQQRLQRERLAQQQAERQEQERQRQQELRRQQEIVAQRYKEEFGNFAQTSTSRLQGIDNEQFRQQQQQERQQLTDRIDGFNRTSPRSEREVNTWNQTGQRLQRDIDAWMTRTNPVVIASARTHLAVNQSESAGARRAAGYNTTGGSGNRNGAGR